MMRRLMAFWSLIAWTLLMISPVKPFNLDDRHFLEIKQDPNQYFGYSVGFRKDSNQYKILVGSPKATDTRIANLSGALYECDLNSQTNCRMVQINLVEGLDIIRENQWLGVDLDINPRDSRIIVCAHRVRKYNTYSDELIGGCYEITDTVSAQTPQSFATTGFMPIFGVSCRYSQDSQLLIGDPGDAKHGGYFIKSPNQNPEYKTNQQLDIYEGYEVTFLDKSPVIGKPRYKEYGAVSVDGELVLSPETKHTFGSYFGSAIDVADINKDGHKDLVIGAPFYSETYPEEGRVYIYLFDKLEKMFFETPDLVLKEPSYRAQFGKSVVTGDFNSDRYQDVIVGAPYENENTGCIYVYNGKYGGLNAVYSQKIKGESLRSGLKSFGISFTRADDVDQNGYADIGVGAYMSDSVYVFKARPAYSATATLTASPRSLDVQPNCFFQERRVLCFNLTVVIALHNIQSVMKYDLHLTTDTAKIPLERRTYFSNRQNELEESVNVQMTFRKEYQIFIKSAMDIMTPIDVTLEYSLTDHGYSSSCQPLCPISNSGKVTDTVKFNLGCGSDEICQTQLRVSLDSSPKTITIGRDKFLRVTVHVQNIREHAYNAFARIFFSPHMDFETVTKRNDSVVECSSVNRMELSCFLGNPMKEYSEQSFTLNFLIHPTSNVTGAYVAVNASTESLVKSEHYTNTKNLTRVFYREYDLELEATSLPDTLVYPGNEEFMTVEYFYHLRNNGPSDAYRVRFSLHFPYIIIDNSPPLLSIKEYRMLDENRVPIQLELNGIICSSVPMVGSRAEHQTNITALFKHKNIANCSWLKCQEIVCNLERLPILHPKVFELTLDVNTKLLKMFQNKLRALNVISDGILNHAKNPHIIKIHQDRANTTTTFIISRLREQIQWWIVVLSIVIGLIFLIIVGIVLWRLGFFRRKRISPAERRSLRKSTRRNPDGTENEETEEKPVLEEEEEE